METLGLTSLQSVSFELLLMAIAATSGFTRALVAKQTYGGRSAVMESGGVRSNLRG